MGTLFERFSGSEGKRRLQDALEKQRLVGGDVTLAQELADEGDLLDIGQGTSLIEQGNCDNDVYFIIGGSFGVFVNGRRIATRADGNHIGEMAAIEPSQIRSATVTADTECVVLKVSEAQFQTLGLKYPKIWRSVAKELAHRLEQRNHFVGETHEKIIVFVMSSVEALPIAHEIQAAFQYDPFSVVIWDNGVFTASSYTIEGLETQVDQSDFAIAIAQADDTTTSRGSSARTPRDNVIFELGFFMGRLGRKRSILLEPRDDLVKLPSDLSGLTTVTYKPTGDPKMLASAMGPACNSIRKIINDLGPNN